ncbi:hypothetical protein KY290_029988 [Solanum tuberosum]|uniref:ubiquitinyl hydrolase 1 n=1 Tax=Solanum tuberosum TaxID=4113 RepID=A0ABQ7UP98_SOLTU|nr:hypothetical protein KY290_029988 [Solanum tuberosum]
MRENEGFWRFVKLIGDNAIVKTLFGIDFDNRIHCAESGEESTETETVYSLKCHISQEVNHLHEGLKRGLKSELEKASPSLGRSAVYLKDSRINRLPRYLTIQFKLEGPRQVLRDAEGKKAGLKSSAKTPVSTDSDTKMTEAEESSSGSGEASKSTSQEEVPTQGIMLPGSSKRTELKWVQFDDDNPIPQREEDITKLSGGGDWHMAYICMYKASVVPI